MKQFFEVKITIYHSSELAAAAIGVSLLSLSNAAAHINTHIIDEIGFSEIELARIIATASREFMSESRNNLVWVQSIDQGSTRLSTKVIYVVGGIIAGGIGGVATDVLEETDAYQEAVDWAADKIDDALEQLGDSFQERLNDGLGHSNVKIDCKREAQTLEIGIHPGAMFRDFPILDR